MYWLRWHYHVKDIAGAPYKIKKKRKQKWQNRRQSVVAGRQQLYCAAELVMGHFFKTQPNPKFLDPTQPNPQKVITWPNPTHHRHLVWHIRLYRKLYTTTVTRHRQVHSRGPSPVSAVWRYFAIFSLLFIPFITHSHTRRNVAPYISAWFTSTAATSFVGNDWRHSTWPSAGGLSLALVPRQNNKGISAYNNVFSLSLLTTTLIESVSIDWNSQFIIKKSWKLNFKTTITWNRRPNLRDVSLYYRRHSYYPDISSCLYIRLTLWIVLTYFLDGSILSLSHL